MMRIITGTARGMKLETLDGEATRPTSERVKEAVFSALQFEIPGKRVLDLFAGSGQMALEALSRGASFAVLTDQNTDAVEVIKRNAKKTGLIKNCKIAAIDYSEYLKSASGRERFDLVFLDPPYMKDIPNEILKKLCKADILSDGAIVVCESDKNNINEDMYGLLYCKTYKYGRTFVTVLRKPAADEKKEGENNE